MISSRFTSWSRREPGIIAAVKAIERGIWALLLFGATACGDDGGGSGDTSDGTTGDATAASTVADDAPTGDGGPGGTTEPGSTGEASTGAPGDTTAGDLCGDELPAIVTDIDETLTLSDEEFSMQIQDGTYDPVEREGGAELIGAYADLGYRILYLTARAETITLEGTGETAREATERWLEEHGYPIDPATTALVLSPSLTIGDATQMYKAGALMEYQAMSWRFDYAYGNATTDIGAYEDAGIDKAATFIIGEQAGVEGTVAIEGEGWVEHSDAHLPTVPAACEPL
jgi:hypothetical protein